MYNNPTTFHSLEYFHDESNKYSVYIGYILVLFFRHLVKKVFHQKQLESLQNQNMSLNFKPKITIFAYKNQSQAKFKDLGNINKGYSNPSS